MGVQIYFEQVKKARWVIVRNEFCRYSLTLGFIFPSERVSRNGILCIPVESRKIVVIVSQCFPKLLTLVVMHYKISPLISKNTLVMAS
jgi:hypothetical protein